jgi:hypothetical protein
MTRSPFDYCVIPLRDVSDSVLTLACQNVIEINNLTSNRTSLEVAMSPELN